MIKMIVRAIFNNVKSLGFWDEKIFDLAINITLAIRILKVINVADIKSIL